MPVVTFARLEGGVWGIRGKGLKYGDPVIITKRDGTLKTGTVGIVVRTFPDGDQLATLGPPPTPRPARQMHNGCTCDDACGLCMHGCRCEAGCSCRGGQSYECG